MRAFKGLACRVSPWLARIPRSCYGEALTSRVCHVSHTCVVHASFFLDECVVLSLCMYLQCRRQLAQKQSSRIHRLCRSYCNPWVKALIWTIRSSRSGGLMMLCKVLKCCVVRGRFEVLNTDSTAILAVNSRHFRIPGVPFVRTGC